MVMVVKTASPNRPSLRSEDASSTEGSKRIFWFTARIIPLFLHVSTKSRAVA